jgi:hypothetical protein
VALPTPVAAHAQDPPFLDWSSALPSLAEGYEPTSADDCVAGRTACVDEVIRAMTPQFDALAGRCDHGAVFALSYLRTTQEYRRTIEDPSFFEDTRFVNHEDAVFARFYFDAFEAWRPARTWEVPRAWVIAFTAAAAHELPASGNLFLGINAHVNRDLPYVLEAIGLVKPDGTSRKRDHDAVNRFLNRVTKPLIAEIARRLDATADDRDLPTALDDVALFQTIPAWREGAWRNAERLAATAPGTAARARVSADIEAYAAAQAESVRRAMAYPPGRSSAERDAFCAAGGAG